MKTKTLLTRELQLELTEEEALALYVNLLYLEFHDGVSPLTKPVMNALRDFVKQEEMHVDGQIYVKDTPR